MMIQRMEIKDYRSCLATSFNWDPHLSVLIGPNGSGKTNILNAALLLRKLTEEEDHYFQGEQPPTAECKLKVWFNIAGKKAILTAKIHTFTDEANDDVIVASKQQWYMKDFTGSGERIKTPLWLAQHIGHRGPYQREVRYIRRRAYLIQKEIGFDMPQPALQAFSAIARDLSNMRYYSASQFTNPSNCPVSFEIEKEGLRSRGFRLRGHAKFLFDLYTAFKAQTDGYKQFFDIVGPDGIALIDTINFKDILTSSIDYSVRSGGKVKQRKREKSLIIPQFTIGKHELSPNQLSEGTFKTITLLFYLITETSSVLLVEEPEVCVHHGLLSSIMELIKTYSVDKQIVVSTHSDFVLDQIPPESVHSVSREPELGTKIKHITKSMSRKELTALRSYLESEGNLGEYWRHGGLEV
jgi:ABC-type lipoprotein export system ATPase subunit